MNEFDPQPDANNDPLKALLKEQAMERAPDSLIEGVMSAIETERAHANTHKPLISRKGWVLLGLGLLLLCTLPLFIGEKAYETTLVSGPMVEWISRVKFPVLNLPQASTTFLTGILAFGVFALLHLYWLKRQLDRKMLV